MTKAELIERIARSRNLPPEMTKKDIGKILGIAFDELATYFAKTRVTRTSAPRFTFPRFGTFTKKKRSARRGVNPRTLEPMTIDACCTVDFKASRELREQMNPATAAKATKTGAVESKSKPAKTSAVTKPARTKAKAKATRTKAATTAAGKPASASGATSRKTTKATKSHAKGVRRTSAKAQSKAVAKTGGSALSGRKLTPRDEDAELDAMIDDASLFAELPSARLQRVRPNVADDEQTGSD